MVPRKPFRPLPSRTPRRGGASWAKRSAALIAVLFLAHLSILAPLSRCLSCGSACPMHGHPQGGHGSGMSEEGQVCRMAHAWEDGKEAAPSYHLALSCPEDPGKAALWVEDAPFLSRPGGDLVLPRLGSWVPRDRLSLVLSRHSSPLIPPG